MRISGLETKEKQILTEENALKALSSLSKHNESEPLEPAASQTSKTGYYYKTIQEAIGCNQGEEVELLEWLADLDCLTKEVFDQLDLCCFCLSANLRMKRLCPSCHSKSVLRKDVVHHFRCGWTGIEETAREETSLVCPKCHRPMRHFGIDYDRSSSYYCLECKRIFTQPDEVLICLDCQKQMPKQDTVLMPIYKYKITQRGIEAIKKKSLKGIMIQRGIIEMPYSLYTLRHIEDRIDELVARYHRYQAGFSLAMISANRFEKLRSDKGLAKASQVVRILSSVLVGETRKLDLPGLYDDHTFLVVLPQTGQKGAQVFARRFLSCVRNLPSSEYLKEITIAIAIATCPEDGMDKDSLLEKLQCRLESAKTMDCDWIVY